MLNNTVLSEDVEDHIDIENDEALVPGFPKYKSSTLVSEIIITPSFRPFKQKDGLLHVKSKRSFLETLNDSAYLQRHRPLELAEKRARKREAELDRYENYIARLKKESPELWSKKSSF